MTRTAARPRTRSSLAPAAVGLVVVAAAILGTLVDRSGTTDRADGALPEGVTVFDDEYPGVANLDPDLLRALREAATDAAHEGIEFHVNSGWRSPEYQDQLLREAVSKYGSAEEAARWVRSEEHTSELQSHVNL